MDFYPKVTVVIPTYNQASYLREALVSLRRQTTPDWEAIVINNCSVDETESVVESFQDSRIRLINFRNHGVIAASRNKGINMARGKFVAFLDSDDVWYPEKLTHCLSVLSQYDADVICHGEVWEGADGYRREVLYAPKGQLSYRELLLGGNRLSTSAVIVRRSMLVYVGGFSENPEFVTAEDYDLWLRLSNVGARFVFVHDVLGKYRIHAEGNSRSIIKNTNAIRAVIDHHLDTFANGTLSAMEKRRAKALVWYGGGREFQKQRKRTRAFILLSRSILLFPFFPRSYAAFLMNFLPFRIQQIIER